MLTVATLATTLQTLFTDTAQRLGRLVGFIRRQRDLTAADFAQTLVFGWIHQPRSTLESFAVALDLSPQALHQRMTPAAQAFFKALLAEAMKHILAARPVGLNLLRRFTAVIVEDTTLLLLPADLADRYRGHGGSGDAGRATLKVLIRWELLTGQLLALECLPGVTNDATLAATSDVLPRGSLHLADQGFFDTARWARMAADQYWISRVPAGVTLAHAGRWRGLADFLSGLGGDDFDGEVTLVKGSGLSCRLTARRCPQEVAARRRRKLRAYTRSKKGREPSARQLTLCDWTVYATNVPTAFLSAAELWLAYRSRWQVELLFKRGKQQLGWTFSYGRKGDRVLTEVLAKLLGCVVVHWTTLLRGGPLAGFSPVKGFRVVQRLALLLAEQLGDPASLADVLTRVERELARIRRQPRRHKHPSTRQLLQDSTLVK
jgi:Transposase DDE domain